MEPVLRPYQSQAVEALRLAYGSGARTPLYAAPTGSGKTVLFAHIAREGARRGTRVLILVHRRELLLQGSRALRALSVPHGLIMPGLPNSDAAVRIASVQTLVRRLERTSPPTLIVIDEAHHSVAGSWGKVLAHWPAARVLGVTATPARLDGKGLGQVFDRLILGPSMTDLVRDGWLVPIEVYAPPVKANLAGLHTRMGDYDRHEVIARMDRPQITGDCVAHYLRLTPGRRGIAFCSSVDHAKHVAEAFNAAGIAADSIDGSMDDEERDGVIARFRNGLTEILTSCEIVSEGFDVPDAEVAILLRPTRSVTVYLQQVGRISRPSPGKAHATVLDHVGNTERLGLPDEDREWSLEGVRRRPRKTAPMRRCPSCFACFIPAPICPMCGFVFPQKEREPIKHTDGELVKVERRQKRREQGQCRTLDELIDLGRRRGYRNPAYWARCIMQARGIAV